MDCDWHPAGVGGRVLGESQVMPTAEGATYHWQVLHWLLLSPPLLVPGEQQGTLVQWSQAQCESITQWLNALRADDAALQAWMAGRAERRLGRYAEHLLEFYLTHGPQHLLVASHIPLRREVDGLQVTQGELDFLLTDAQGQRLHWELAVKFFMCTATGDVATPEDFIGPNGVETLAQKWHKLFARQLTHMPPAPWDAHAWQPQAFTRGWMFYRWGHAVPRCEALHPEHGKGWWLDIDHCAELPDAYYACLTRWQWLAPWRGHATDAAQAGVVVVHRDEVAAYLRSRWASGEDRATAQMVAQLAEPAAQAEQGVQTELQRFFIRNKPVAHILIA
jgi:uncharacterized protein